tara:strand:+ start:4348 stop:4557 length:210 start_codon:yes stop_codon:yes gene_type:complete
MNCVNSQNRGRMKRIEEPETPLEAVELLQEFFECDMWYAKGAEWKTEEDMLKYLRMHFDVCKQELKSLK